MAERRTRMVSCARDLQFEIEEFEGLQEKNIGLKWRFEDLSYN
jgi:hypothetical protein